MGRSSARIRSGGGASLMSEAALTQSSQAARLEAAIITESIALSQQSATKASQPPKRHAAGGAGPARKRPKRGSSGAPVSPVSPAPGDAAQPAEPAQAAPAAVTVVTVAATAAVAAPELTAVAAEEAAEEVAGAAPAAGATSGLADEDPDADLTIPSSQSSSADGEGALERASRGSWSVPANPAEESEASCSQSTDDAMPADEAPMPDDGDDSEFEAEQEELALLDSEEEEDGDVGEAERLGELADADERSQALNAEFDRSRPRLQVGLSTAAPAARKSAGNGQLKLCLGGSAGAAAEAAGGGDADGASTETGATDWRAELEESGDGADAGKPLHPFFSRAPAPSGVSSAVAAPSTQRAAASAETDSGSKPPRSPAAVSVEDAGQHWSAFWHAKTGAEPSARSQAAAAALRQGGQAKRRVSAAAAAGSSGSRFAECPCCSRSVAVGMLDEHLDRCGIAPSPSSADADDRAGEGGAAAADSARPAARPVASAGSSAVVANESSSGSTQSSDSSVAGCPICQKQVAVSYMSMHLDVECSGEVEAADAPVSSGSVAPSSSRQGGSGTAARSAAGAAGDDSWTSVATEWSTRWDQLGRELACSICLCLFDQPCTLPCQHSFCKECALHALRASRDSVCPLCKAPTYPREVKPNPHLEALSLLLSKPLPNAPGE